jgi:hypothetical protein
LHSTVSRLKPTELHTLNGCIVWYVSPDSMTLLPRGSEAIVKHGPVSWIIQMPFCPWGRIGSLGTNWDLWLSVTLCPLPIYSPLTVGQSCHLSLSVVPPGHSASGLGLWPALSKRM